MGQVLIICAICDHLYRNVKTNFDALHCEHLVDEVLQVGQMAAVFNLFIYLLIYCFCGSSFDHLRDHLYRNVKINFNAPS